MASANSALEVLVTQWFDFATSLREGYTGTIDDYTNDLTLRDSIESSLGSREHDPASPLFAQLTAADEAFTESTRSDDAGVLARYYAVGNGWWWGRFPEPAGRLAAYV